MTTSRSKPKPEPRVRDLMQRDVVTIDASATLAVADKLMRIERIEHLPVLADGKLVGVLAQRDVFHASPSSALGEPDAEIASLERIPVLDVMSPEVFVARPDSTLLSAVEMMLLEGVGCLPVVEDDVLVGFISETDCLRYLATLLRPE